ncbi:MAG: hypothetical protein HY974_00915 [Candidatus Kerfeldbacteria bacterium]|nr:hypothetical protein [Candidatus Kerfeldbacteria bacterium]
MHSVVGLAYNTEPKRATGSGVFQASVHSPSQRAKVMLSRPETEAALLPATSSKEVANRVK